MLEVSDKIKVFLQESKPNAGSHRGVRATNDINVGESLLREQPTAWVLSADGREQYCQYCFVELDNGIVCSRCLFPRYCGEECKNLDEIFHETECRELQNLLPLVPSSSVRLLASMAQLRCKNASALHCKSKKDNTSGINGFPSDIRELQSNTQHLCKHQFMSGLETFQRYLTQSGVTDDVDIAMEIFGQIECNSFDVLDMEQKSIGAAIYLRASMFNHSCKPNCVAVFDGNVIEVRSIVDIKTGEECVISYCELLAPTHERQKKLRDQFHFTCTCPRCQEEKNMESAMPNDQNKMLDIGEQKNQASGAEKNQSKQDLEERSLDMLKKVEELSNEGKFSEGIDLCTECLVLQRAVFPAHYYIIVRTLDALVDLHVELGEDLDKAAECGDETLEAYRLHYPSNYPSIAWQLRKVALIHSLLEDRREQRMMTAIILLSQAKKIFLISHGERHPLVEDSQTLLSDWTETLQQIQQDKTS